MSGFLLSDSVDTLRGIGPAKAALFRQAGIRTLEDLLMFFPRTYRSDHVSLVSSEQVGSYSGYFLTVENNPYVFSMAGRKRVLRYLAKDENGVSVHILHMNQPYLKNKIQKGDAFFFFGILQEKNGVYYLFSPEFREEKPDPNLIYPIYPTIGNISSKQIEKIIRQFLPYCPSQIQETLPLGILERFFLMPKAKALLILHLPPSRELLQKAKERFVFESLFDFSVQSDLFFRKTETKSVQGFSPVSLDSFFRLLPYSPTDAQKRVLSEISEEITGHGTISPMNRLVQGDVGSGKTVVAAGAAYLAIQNQKSVLVMAPTEILARQHYATFQKIFAPIPVEILLLTGSATKKERAVIFEKTISDRPYILIGTHALIEDSSLCRNVGIAITDEQHRFGVRQRGILGQKGGAMHSMVMSATPIPRSLALFLYAKNKISVLDQLPPGRKPVHTFYIGEDKIHRLYRFLKERAEQGHQAYIVCPLIEDEEEKSPLQSAKKEYEDLKKALSGIEIDLIHGKLKNDEKDRIMQRFQKGEVKILISTTVIEVGVDVPNASVMVVRNAERFGLSQLHQLRGRVGRGSEESYCVLVSSHSSQSARERLKKLCDCHDGFELARFDLEHRGPGDFFGTRQSGFEAALSVGMGMEEMTSISNEAELFLNEAGPEELIPYERATRLN